MTIENEKVVNLHYHLTTADGQVIESSRGGAPLTYLHGAGTLLASLEHALTGFRRRGHEDRHPASGCLCADA
jgi:FKBP-type peptidyl-prolyl cis-trans isomerase SlyD